MDELKPAPLQARIVSGPGGVRWLLEGWSIFRRAMLGWLALVAAYLLVTNLLAYLPVVGIFLALAVVPPLSVGLMAGARAAAHGTAPEIGMLFDGFRNGSRAQVALGLGYMVCSVLVFLAVALADGSGQLRAALSGRLDPQESSAGELVAPLLVGAVLYTPVMMAYWFAPVLAAWHSTGAAKALFFSFYACLINWRAFLAYGAAVAALMLVLPFVALTVLVLLTGGSVKLSAMGLLAGLLLVLLPTLLASFYASYRDVFVGTGEGPGTPG